MRSSVRIFSSQKKTDGSSSEQRKESYIAGELLSAIKVVFFDGAKVRTATNTINIELLNVVGLTLFSAAEDDSVDVIYHGLVEDGSFLFSPGDILYLSSSGNITTNTVGNILQIGRAVDLGKIFINIQEPILRN